MAFSDITFWEQAGKGGVGLSTGTKSLAHAAFVGRGDRILIYWQGI